MCFSAAASFIAAGALAAVGGASIGAAADKRATLFAAVPLGFAAQQGSEGVVWLTIDVPPHHLLLRTAVFVFLAFALVVWPTWIPIAVGRAERDAERRRWLARLTWIGVLVSAVALVLLIGWEPHARIDGHSLRYTFGANLGDVVRILLVAAYVVPTLGPFFVSTINLSDVFGAALIVSMIAALVIRHEALTSVWCFFAAVLSAIVFVSVRRRPPIASPEPERRA
jgi:hypothetical protein